MRKTSYYIGGAVLFFAALIWFVIANLADRRDRLERDRLASEALMRELEAKREAELYAVPPRVLEEFRTAMGKAIEKYRQRRRDVGDTTGAGLRALRRQVEQLKQKALEQCAQRTDEADRYRDKWRATLDREAEAIWYRSNLL